MFSGTWSAGGSTPQCQPCTAGSTTAGSASPSADECSVCLPGWGAVEQQGGNAAVATGSAQCVACGFGFYSASNVCVACAPGYTSPERSAGGWGKRDADQHAQHIGWQHCTLQAAIGGRCNYFSICAQRSISCWVVTVTVNSHRAAWAPPWRKSDLVAPLLLHRQLLCATGFYVCSCTGMCC